MQKEELIDTTHNAVVSRDVTIEACWIAKVAVLIFKIVEARSRTFSDASSFLSERKAIIDVNDILVATQTSFRVVFWAGFARVITLRVYRKAVLNFIDVIVKLPSLKIESRHLERICSFICVWVFQASDRN